MMNQYPGQYGPSAPSGPGYGPSQPGQRPPGPPGPNMYNGQGQPPMNAPGQFGGQKAMQNGPSQGQYGSGPQGDFGGPRPPGMYNQGPRPPVSSMGQQTNQMTNQMGGMNISGPSQRGPAPMGGNPMTSTAGGYGAPVSSGGMPPAMGRPPGMNPPSSSAGPSMVRGPGPSQGMPPVSMGMGQPPTSMGRGPMGAPPTSMGAPPTIMGAPPTSRGMGPPPTSMGAPPTSMGAPPSMGMGPPPSSMGMGPPPTRMGRGAPTKSMGMGPPPTSMGMGAPPTSRGMGPPPTSVGAPPSSMGYQQNQGMNPASTNMGNAAPPTSMGTQSSSLNMGQQPQGQGYGQPPMPIDMRGQQGGYGAQPSPNSQAGFPPQGGPPQQNQFSYQGQSNQYMGGASQMGGAPQQPLFGGAPPMGGAQQQMGRAPQYGAPGAGGYGGAPGGMQQPQQKRLDPDQMPSPIQVIEDDKKNRGGVFSTGARGTVPPLVTTPFITHDQGNSNPAFLRASMYNLPCTSDMAKNSHIPMALAISPFAKLQDEEQSPPVVNLGELGPVRCKRCKAYMSPHMMFIDMGNRFQCVFCGAATDVPVEYFANLDHTGRRVDCSERPELCLGSYEFVATKDYCKNGVLPNAPAFIFMIDVSYNSIKSGLVHLICDRLKEDILMHLPREAGADQSEIRVGFVTYGKDIHFYNVKGALAQPQMLVVSDLEDMFVPLLDGFLVTLAESEAVIDSLLAQIPQMFSDSRETEVVLGPVIQAGLDALKAADRAGKLYIFHTSLPIAEAPGRLKNRDDRKLLGTDKEKTILSPQTNFYHKLGQECVAAGCSVDLFLFPNSYIDVATISDICRLTSGNLYKYSYFQADLDGDIFMEDLKNNIQSQKAFDAIIRVRTSQGIRPVDFLGNFYMSNTTDVEMCAIDSNQAITVEIKHDDKLSEVDGAYVQVAVLFTSVSGQRRLRIHNQALNCCTQLADLFRNCELDVTINFMAKYAVRSALNKSPKETREHIMDQTANILACYRKNCASPSSAGQLILPECMKLLPVYANCVIKSDGIQGGTDISTDDRSYLMHMINAMDVSSTCAFFYPRLIQINNLTDSDELPVAIRCSAERLRDDGVYLLENGVSMFLWIGLNTSPEWIQQVFSVQSAAQIDIDKCRLLELDNPVSIGVRKVIKKVRASRQRYMKLRIVRQRDPLEPWFNHFLVEDKGINGTASYVDFLCHIHKEIRNLLN